MPRPTVMDPSRWSWSVDSGDAVADDALDDAAAHRVHRRLEARVGRSVEERLGGVAIRPRDDELEAAGRAPVGLGAEAARRLAGQRPALVTPPGRDRIG